MKDKLEIESLLEFATDLTREAGQIAMQYFRAEFDMVNKSTGDIYDPVTRADREIELFLKDGILKKYPGHSIIGEESDNIEGEDPYTWLIDPIDGTRGFVSGSPMWGMLVGIKHHEDCIAGLMHQPFVNETFAGSINGSYLIDAGQKRQIKVSQTQDLSEAIICCTHLAMFHNSSEMDSFIRVANGCRFSRFGTDCYGYCLLSHGLVDLVVEGNMAAYDIMPLIPVIEGADGIVTDWQGNSAKDGGNIIASATSKLHEQALNLINNRD